MKVICVEDYLSTSRISVAVGDILECEGDKILKNDTWICDINSPFGERYFEEYHEAIKSNYNNQLTKEESDHVAHTLNEKESNKMNVIKAVKELNIDTKILKSIEQYIVDSDTVRLTPSGLAIDGKVFSRKTEQLLDVRGTELPLDIPVGFCIPTDASNIAKGDIIYNSEGKAFHVLYVNEKTFGTFNKKKTPKEVICISPNEDRKITMIPTVDIFGNQVYNKLITPFNFDMGCNPLLNVAAVLGTSIINKDINSAIDTLLPQSLKLISKIDLNAITSDKRVVFLSPLLIFLYKMSKDKEFDLNSVKDYIFNIDKKTKILIVLALAMVLYISKDKIAELIMSDRLDRIPLVNKVSKPLGRLLVKIPSVKLSVIKGYSDRIVGMFKSGE
jgi:hypothetical protein